MTACMRRFDRVPRGCRWFETDLEGNEKAEVIGEPLRKAVLMFLQGVDPSDIYTIDTGPNCVIVYYRR